MKLLTVLLLLFAPVFAQEEKKAPPITIFKIEEKVISDRPTTTIKITLQNTGSLAIRTIMFDIAFIDVNRGGEVDKIRSLLGQPNGTFLKAGQSKTVEHDLGYYAPNGWMVNEKTFRIRNIVFSDNSMWINPEIIDEKK